MPKTKEQEEAERKAAEAEAEEAKRKAAEEEASEEDTEQEEEDLSPDELKAKLAENEKKLRAANKESKERRLRLEQLEKEKKEKEEADLSEKEKAEKRASEAEARAAALEQKNRSLMLSQEFASAAGRLKVSFVSDFAKATALKLLDMEEVGDDFSGMEGELKRLAKDHSYLFGKPDPTQFIDDGSRKTKVTSSTVTQKAIENQRKHITPL